MKISNKGIELISSLEGLRLKAYKCSAGVPTIGIGSTFYEDKTRIKMGDIITRERAFQLFSNTVKSYESAVRAFVKPPLTQNQFDALVSLVYNIGAGNFSTSTVLKRININPNDKEGIEEAWKRWNKANKKVVKGLVIRRNKELEYYFQ